MSIAQLQSNCLLWHEDIKPKDSGGISLLTVPLTGYRNRKLVNCLFIKTTIRTALC